MQALEMEAQFNQLQTEQEHAEPVNMSADVDTMMPVEQAPVDGYALPILPTVRTLTADEQKSRLAKAEAAYGAVTEVITTPDHTEQSMDRRA